MMRGRMITAAVLAVVGLAWIGQGLGLLRGSSFMVGDPIWAAIGAALVVAAVAVAVTAWRRRET
jgi:predicted Co/Zn/Cd cation transporter (cation efflux family)